MKATFASFLAVLAGLQTVAAKPAPKVLTDEHRAKIVENYINIWKGDLSLLNSTFSPSLQFNADRFPSDSGVGSDPQIITNPNEFGEFVISSGQGFTSYGFEPFYWLGREKYISIRWHLVGVVGNITQFPTTLKPGDSITYNGTDNLVLNTCTGLVDQVDSAQDLITLFHAFGLTSVTV